jgi:molybdenum cofactor biosynthesis enzyme MoaA
LIYKTIGLNPHFQTTSTSSVLSLGEISTFSKSFSNKTMHKPHEEIMSKENMKKIIKDCKDFGISVMNFVGGEPLLNNNLPELISSIDKDKNSFIHLY